MGIKSDNGKIRVVGSKPPIGRLRIFYSQLAKINAMKYIYNHAKTA